MLWCSQVNILRALSVAEGKGAVSWVASQSREGTPERGNFEACVSTAAKSRQRRQGGGAVVREDGGAEAVVAEWGFVVWSLNRSGRELRGMGGGSAMSVDNFGLGSRSLVPFVCNVFVSLFIPKERADLEGLGGACSAGGGNVLDGCNACSGLAGVLGGKAGV